MSDGSQLPRSHSRLPVVHGALTPNEKMELREIFVLCDGSGSGQLDRKELRKALRGLGFPVRKLETNDLVKKYAKPETTTIAFEEFLNIVEALATQLHDPRREILETFQLFDIDDKGQVTAATLRAIARQLGDELSYEDAAEMILAADIDGNGIVTRDEFVRYMLRTSLFTRVPTNRS
eukprot:m.246355 g.246355  ORF g.246355 m.246355 type:complete len:178 (-) comp15014_c0_seq1:257-790(-)